MTVRETTEQRMKSDMARRGLTAPWIALGLLLVAGCGGQRVAPPAERDAVHILAAMQKLHGPPAKLVTIRRAELSEPAFLDSDRDGQPETILFFGDEGLGRPTFGPGNTEGRGVICRGFLVLTTIDEDVWPVFYYFNEYRCQIHLRQTDRETGLVASGGREGERTFWGWRGATPDWPARWIAERKVWDASRSAYGPPQIFPTLLAIYGK